MPQAPKYIDPTPLDPLSQGKRAVAEILLIKTLFFQVTNYY